MTEKSFVLVSLKQEKTRQLSKVLSNDTSRQILEYLSGKEHATETQISKDLKLPISTTHYNLKALTQAKLVTEDEYHYSEKGKEVIHYKLANKYIIIAPTEDETILDKLKQFIPAAIIFAGATAAIWLTQFFTATRAGNDMQLMAAEAAFDTNEALAMKAAAPMAQAAPVAQTEPNIALWFLIGGAACLTAIIIWEIIRLKIQKNK